MSIHPIPVTFHVRAERDLRPGLRARPHRMIARAVAAVSAIGVGFGVVVGSTAPAHKANVADARSAVAPAVPAPSMPALGSKASVSSPARPIAASGADYTPVGSIRDRDAAGPPAFPPVERAPDYAGFRVVAGK